MYSSSYNIYKTFNQKAGRQAGGHTYAIYHQHQFVELNLETKRTHETPFDKNKKKGMKFQRIFTINRRRTQIHTHTQPYTKCKHGETPTHMPMNDSLTGYGHHGKRTLSSRSSCWLWK